MHKRYIALIIILMVSIAIFTLGFTEEKYSISYWLWAGITSKDAPPNSELYIYQGLITYAANRINYQRVGLYPHPIKGKRLYLVYRLEGDLPDSATTVVSIFQNSAAQWQKHSVIPDGLQLDFDSPTSKLLIYSNFLREVRQQLPKQYALSITGLGDWAIYGDKHAMKSIASITDEIVFQLYQGWYPLPDIDIYVKTLSNYPLPFKVGLLSRYPDEKYIAFLKKNYNFKGIIYFIQKDP